MRTIKFRGKDFAGVWWYGYLSSYENNPVIHPLKCVGVSMMVDEETIGQYTGLTDRNGEEIYEGDIVDHPYIDPIFGDLVEMKDGKGVKSVVVFHEGAFCVRYGEDVFYYLDQFTRHKHIEVVGNIHDNPELLGEKGGEQ